MDGPLFWVEVVPHLTGSRLTLACVEPRKLEWIGESQQWLSSLTHLHLVGLRLGGDPDPSESWFGFVPFFNPCCDTSHSEYPTKLHWLNTHHVNMYCSRNLWSSLTKWEIRRRRPCRSRWPAYCFVVLSCRSITLWFTYVGLRWKNCPEIARERRNYNCM